jgi:hypothetical protein
MYRESFSLVDSVGNGSLRVLYSPWPCAMIRILPPGGILLCYTHNCRNGDAQCRGILVANVIRYLDLNIALHNNVVGEGSILNLGAIAKDMLACIL